MLKVIENLQVEKTLLKLIKENEPFQKDKNVVSAREVFHLMDKRFCLVKGELLPLYEALSKELIITDIYYERLLGDEISIVVRFDYEGKQDEIDILQDNLGEITLTQGKYFDKHLALFEKYRKIIEKTFEGLFYYNFDQHLEIPTTTKLFRVSSDLNGKSIYDIQKRFLNISIPYRNGDRVSSCVIPKVSNYLTSNSDEIIDHFMIYEENIPTYLKKIK